MCIEKGKVSITVPLAERDPEQVREALKSQSEFVQEQFMSLHAYACEKNLSLAQLADKTRISGGSLSPAFAGKYPGNYAAIATRISGYFKRLAVKDRYGDLDAFVKTDLVKYLWLIYDKTGQNRRIQLIESEEGMSKSASARAYVAQEKQDQTERTIYVQISGGSGNGVNEFIRSLANTLGIERADKTSIGLLKYRIREALESYEAIILDEIHVIWSWSLRAQRLIMDYIRTDLHANGVRVVVLLSTNDNFYGRLKLLRQAAKYNVGQIIGRMAAERIVLDAKMIEADDVHVLAGKYYQAGAAVRAELLRIAQLPQMGHLHLLLQILGDVGIKATARGKPMTDEMVLAQAQTTLNQFRERKETIAA